MIALLAALLATTPQEKPSAADAAAKFSLDLPASDVPAEPVVAPPVVPADAAVTTPPEPAATTTEPSFSLDTPIATLLADYRAKAVLDRNLPGLSTDENLAKFQRMSLRQFAPLTGGQLTPELMTKTAYDLAAIGAGTAMPPAAKRRSVGR